MRSLGPRQVITELIAVRNVVPRQPVYGVVSVGAAGKVNVWDTVIDVGTGCGEYAVRSFRKPRDVGCGKNACGNNVNAIAVIGEGDFIEQIRPDRIGSVHYCAV